MCGIAGIYHFDKECQVDHALLKKATDIIKYRGPDDYGFYINKNIGLGHRRLAIIDLNSGSQPMYNDDKSIVIVFNGEIYNYIELKEELKKNGYIFHTTSDTEVIIKAYEEWGVDCQKKFNGMWAFAIWDNNRQSLFVSRDRVGEKPVHYSLWNNAFYFGSEIKSIHALGVPREIASEYTELYLVFTNIPAPYTYFKNVYKLLPGHFLWIVNSHVTENKYWDLPEIDEYNMLNNRKKIYEEFEHLLHDSVKIRMRSDVPFGAFLSSGLDSSAIVTLMSDISTLPVNTFTIGFPEKEYDETKLARIVARQNKTMHHEGTVHPSSFKASMVRLAFHFDEPFGDASSMPTYFVSKLAKKTVSMVLTGDGGDEILSGYNSYLGVKISDIYLKLPELFRRFIPFSLEMLKPLFKGNLRYNLNRIKRFCEAVSTPFNENVLNKRAFADYMTIKEIIGDMRCMTAEDYIHDFMNQCTYNDNFYKIMYLHFKYDLPNDFLVKVDRMSMANSLEARVPFLDHRLIEFMVHVDKNIKLQGFERKSVLKKSIGRRLPGAILSGAKKGFTIPLTVWFKRSEFCEIQAGLAKTNWDLNNDAVNNIVKKNIKGHNDHGTFIWSLLVLKQILESKTP